MLPYERPSSRRPDHGVCVLSLHPGFMDLMPKLVQYNILILSHVFHLGLLGFEILGLGFWISGTAWFGMDKLVQSLGSQGGYHMA